MTMFQARRIVQIILAIPVCYYAITFYIMIADKL